MPNHPAMAGAMMVAGLAVATAIAIYESPHARQLAQDVRRKIAIALHSLGDEINPESNDGQPRFNRPEDAEGFKLSMGNASNEADEESKRHQREELLHWNAVKIALEEKIRQSKEKSPVNDVNGGSRFAMPLQNYDDAGTQETQTNSSSVDVAPVADQNIRRRSRKYSTSDSDFLDHRQNETDIQKSLSDLYESSDVSLPGTAKVNAAKNFEEPKVKITADAKNTYDSIHAWAETSHANSNPNISCHLIDSKSPNLSQSLLTPEFESFPTADIVGQETDFYAKQSGYSTPTDECSIVGSKISWKSRSSTISGDEAIDLVSLNGGSSITGNWTDVASVVSENDSF